MFTTEGGMEDMESMDNMHSMDNIMSMDIVISMVIKGVMIKLDIKEKNRFIYFICIYFHKLLF